MQTIRILYLRNSVLEEAESLENGDLLEAIDKASGRPPEVTAEIWSERGKVGIVGPSPRLNLERQKSDHD